MAKIKQKYKPKLKPQLSKEEIITRILDKDWSQPVIPPKAKETRQKSLSSTSTRELRKMARELQEQTNKRIKRLEKQNLTTRSKAYQELTKNRGKKPRFDVEGLGKKKLIDAIKEMESFTKAKTSTPSGVRKMEERTEQRLSELGVSFRDKEERDDFFEKLGRFKELYKDNPKVNKVKPSDIMKKLKASYDRQLKTKGYVDEKSLFDSLKRKIDYAERSLASKEERETKALYTRGK